MDFDLTLFEQRQEEEHSQRLLTYKRNWEYYQGIHKLPLPVRTGQPDDNVIINLARLVVDKGVSFLFGKEIEFQLMEGKTTPEEELLADIWRANRKMTFLSKLGVSGGVYGHMFIKIQPDDLRGVSDKGMPRFINLEPEYVKVLYDPGDIDMVHRYTIEWTAVNAQGKGMHYRQIIAKNDGGRWEIANERARVQGRWEADPDKPDMIWPFGWPPIVDAQNIPVPGVYYGMSDLEDLSLQDAANYAASKLQRISRYHAHPKTVASGMGNGDIKVNEDEIALLPSPESKLYNLEMQSDLGGLQNFLSLVVSLYLRCTQIPNLDPAQVNFGALSGLALRMHHAGLLEKTEMKRRTYGDMLIEINRRLLDLKGKGAENYCDIHWPDPLPVDHTAEKERDTFEIDYGLTSKETVRTRRGLDNKAEMERLDAEKMAANVRDGNVGALLVRNWQSGQDNATPSTPRPEVIR